MRQGTRILRKALVAAVGLTVIVVGIVLIPLPGPGTLIVLGGLAILGSEFPAARRLVEGIKRRIRSAMGKDPAPAEEE